MLQLLYGEFFLDGRVHLLELHDSFLQCHHLGVGAAFGFELTGGAASSNMSFEHQVLHAPKHVVCASFHQLLFHQGKAQ